MGWEGVGGTWHSHGCPASDPVWIWAQPAEPQREHARSCPLGGACWCRKLALEEQSQGCQKGVCWEATAHWCRRNLWAPEEAWLGMGVDVDVGRSL